MTAVTSRRLFDAAWCAVLAATVAAVCAMAFVSASGAHPDEKDHVGAGRYYMQYWDTPKVGDPRAQGAYSNYGVSYLHQLDSVYFFAGKFARLAKPLAGSDELALRLFNVSLFLVLAGLCWRLKGSWRLCFVPLFATPQGWYVFSYFNGDALPLFLGFVTVFVLARLLEGSRLSGPGGADASGLAVVLGLAVGGLSVSKQNYYVYLAFFAVFVFLAWRDGALRVRVCAACAVLAVVLAVGLFGLRYGMQAFAERGQDSQAVARVAEQLAQPDLKPSAQERGEGYWGTRMRARGVTLGEMFTGEWKWHVFTFRSAAGLYGQMSIEAPLLFYRWLGRAQLAFLALLAAGLVLRGREARVGFGVWLVFAFLTVGQSVWHSWNNDFQAQGRYLFPVLPMAGCLLARFKDAPGRLGPWLWGVGLGIWGMSLWSFLAVGLARIAR